MKAVPLIRFCLLPIILGLLGSSVIQAQTLLEAKANQAIQRDQQRRDDIQRRLEQERRERTRTPAIIKELKKPVEPSDYCFKVNTVTIKGADWLAEDVKAALIAPWIGRCVSRVETNQLLQQITHLYFEAGYITSRAYIPQQTLVNGVLVIHVVEGRLEHIQSDTAKPVSLTTAFPGMEGELLNLRDLEQGLEQINRLASCQATMKLRPGSFYGASIIDVNSHCAKPYQLRVGRNNSGQPATGEQQLSVFGSWDSPLALNDYVYLSYQGDTKKDGEGKKSESISGHWDLPYGYWLLSIDASRFEYASIVAGSFSQFETAGFSDSQALSIDKTVYRDQDSKTKIGFALTRRKNENTIEDIVIDASSRTLSSGELSLQYERYLDTGALLIGQISYERGLKLFGSPDDKKAASDAPKAQFNKFNITIDYRQSWSNQLSYLSTFKAQQSDDVLFSSEQFSIGSEYTVRGYKDVGLSARSGAYWRNTLEYRWATGWGGDVLRFIKPFAGVDVGAVRNTLFDDHKYAKLKGQALGVAFGGDVIDGNFTYTRAIDKPDYLPLSQEYWHFNISATF